MSEAPKKAKRRLKNFSFADEKAHVALVDEAANGESILVMKSAFADQTKFEDGDEVPLESSGFRVNMSLEDAIMMLTGLWPEHIELLTQSIMKAKDGPELIELVKFGMPEDLFDARRDMFELQVKETNEQGMHILRMVAMILEDFFSRGISPGDSDSSVAGLSDLVEKSEMSKDNANASTDDQVTQTDDNGGDAVNAEVQKTLGEAQATIEKQAARIEALEKRETARVVAQFVAKAKTLSPLGLPEAPEGTSAESQFGLALKALSDADADSYALVESVLLKALDTVANADKLEETGIDGQPETTGGNDERLEKAVAEIQKADSNLTYEQAVVKAYDADPSLYDDAL